MPAAASRCPEVRFDRAEQQRRIGGAAPAEHGAQRARLDGVAQQCAGAVGLDVVDLAGFDARRHTPTAAPPSARRGWAPSGRWSGRPGSPRIPGPPRGSGRRHAGRRTSRLSTATPAPSPRTKPSALASNAWHWPVFDIASSWSKLRVTAGESSMLTPAASARFESPARRLWHARWMVTSDDEHAVSTVIDGPRRSK